MKSVFEIAKNLKITPRAVHSRFDTLGIRGKKRITTHYYTPEQIKKISHKKHKKNCDPMLSNPKYYQSKVDIIEMYLAQDDKNSSEISRVLKLDLSICIRTVRDFKQKGFLIIKSKL